MIEKILKTIGFLANSLSMISIKIQKMEGIYKEIRFNIIIIFSGWLDLKRNQKKIVLENHKKKNNNIKINNSSLHCRVNSEEVAVEIMLMTHLKQIISNELL